jgi:hypothetical protein
MLHGVNRGSGSLRPCRQADGGGGQATGLVVRSSRTVTHARELGDIYRHVGYGAALPSLGIDRLAAGTSLARESASRVGRLALAPLLVVALTACDGRC